VQIRLWEEAKEVRVSFKDQGPGLNAEDQKKLFQRFARLSARPTGGESSTGLGLSIVHRLARAMGGDVTCACAPGEAATFTLHLPGWVNAPPHGIT